MIITNNGPKTVDQVARHFKVGDLFLSPEEYQRESAWDLDQKLFSSTQSFGEWICRSFSIVSASRPPRSENFSWLPGPGNGEVRHTRYPFEAEKLLTTGAHSLDSGLRSNRQAECLSADCSTPPMMICTSAPPFAASPLVGTFVVLPAINAVGYATGNPFWMCYVADSGPNDERRHHDK